MSGCVAWLLFIVRTCVGIYGVCLLCVHSLATGRSLAIWIRKGKTEFNRKNIYKIRGIPFAVDTATQLNYTMNKLHTKTYSSPDETINKFTSTTKR